MADELDEIVVRELELLDELEAPDLWARIMTLADTERVEQRRPRRRWPVLTVAALALTAVAVGVVVWVSDPPPSTDRSSTSTPPAAVASNDNTVRVDLGDDALDVTPTATAGWVSLAVENPTGRIRTFDVLRLVPGRTVDDVERAMGSIDPAAPEPLAGIVESDPLVGGFTTPGSAHTVGVPLPAGEYVVVSLELDGALEQVAGSGRSRPLHIGAGRAGRAPTPTLTYQLIGDTPIGPTSTPAGRTVLTFDDGGRDAPSQIVLADLRDGAVQVDWDRWSPWSLPNEGRADWDAVPADSLIALWGSVPGRTVTLDLDLGPIVLVAGTRLDQLSFRSIAFIQVD